MATAKKTMESGQKLAKETAKKVASTVSAAKEMVSKTEMSSFDPYAVIKFPLSTEKSIRQIEFDNKLVFVVDAKSTKSDVKRAVEELFKVKVINVNIHNSFTGQKKAYVKLHPSNLASDVSADLGLI